MDELISSTSVSESDCYGAPAELKQHTTREECNQQRFAKRRKQKVIFTMSKIPQKVVNNLRARILKKPRKKLVVEPVDLNYKTISSKQEFIINECDSYTSMDSHSCFLPFSQPSGCPLSSKRGHRSLSCFTGDSQRTGRNDIVALLPDLSFDGISNTSSIPEKDEIVMRPVFASAVPNALVNDSYDNGYTSIHVAVSYLHNFQNSPVSSTATNVLLDDDAISTFSDEVYPSEKRIENISIDRIENSTRLGEFQEILHSTRSREDIPLISQCSTLSADYTEYSDVVLVDLDGSNKDLQDYRERSSSKENFIWCNQAVEFYGLPFISRHSVRCADLVKVPEVISTDLGKSGKYLNDVASTSGALSLDNQKRPNITSIKTNYVLFAALCSIVILTTGATLLAIFDRHKIIDVRGVLMNFLQNIPVRAENLLNHYYLRIDNASMHLVQLAKDIINMLRHSLQFNIDKVFEKNAECMLANEISQKIQTSQRFDEVIMTAVEFMMQ